MAAQNGLGQMFVSGDEVDIMIQSTTVQQNTPSLGLPPDQPTTLQWMYCAETEAEAEEGWTYFLNQLLAARYHYFEWQRPVFKGVPGYEHYEKERTADFGRAQPEV